MKKIKNAKLNSALKIMCLILGLFLVFFSLSVCIVGFFVNVPKSAKAEQTNVTESSVTFTGQNFSFPLGRFNAIMEPSVNSNYPDFLMFNNFVITNISLSYSVGNGFFSVSSPITALYDSNSNPLIFDVSFNSMSDFVSLGGSAGYSFPINSGLNYVLFRGYDNSDYYFVMVRCNLLSGNFYEFLSNINTLSLNQSDYITDLMLNFNSIKYSRTLIEYNNGFEFSSEEFIEFVFFNSSQIREQNMFSFSSQSYNIDILPFLSYAYNIGVDNGGGGSGETYEEAFNRGFDEGYRQGYSKGSTVSSDALQAEYERGYNIGRTDGYDDGKEDGIFEGYERASDEVYESAYNAGKQAGYQLGFEDGSGDLTFSKLFNNIMSIFEVKIFGIVSLADFFIVLFGLSMLFFVLKLFVGG